MTSEAIVVPITPIEEHHLAQLVDDFLELIGASRDSDDPAIARLTPNPYPDDADSAAGFADTTRDDLLDRRVADARRVRASIGDADGDSASFTDGTLSPKELAVPVDLVDAWLRTLTAIRLVIATRLGIVSDEDSGADGSHDVYDWLGYRLELLIQAADDAGTGLRR